MRKLQQVIVVAGLVSLITLTLGASTASPRQASPKAREEAHDRVRHALRRQPVHPADRAGRTRRRQGSRRQRQDHRDGRLRRGRAAQDRPGPVRVRRRRRRDVDHRATRWPSGLNTLIGQGKPIVEFNIYSSRGQRAVRGRTLGGRLGDPREDGAAEARRPRPPAEGDHRHLRPGVPGARQPDQRRQEGPRQGADDQGPVRRHGRPDEELRSVAAAHRGQPRREGADRPLRPGPREPRQAEQAERQQVHHRRRRPDARQPRRDRERERASSPSARRATCRATCRSR